jgi:basic amino acid/polyamine antiporter, APA family
MGAARRRAGGDRDAPARVLGTGDAIALVLGIVIGAGIFRAPSVVAQGGDGVAAVLGAWIAGGVVSLAGAMCYAELAAAYPHSGGDYHFLRRALGPRVAFLFAWARITVIPTGSVALLGFVFGDYVAAGLGLPGASGAFAALMVVGLTAANVAGLQVARRTQVVLTIALVAGLLLVIATGLALPPAPPEPAGPATAPLGLAMVFVLLAYGGWNEAAYVSAELRGGRRAIAGALVASLLVVTALYVLANVAYLRGLGLAGVRASEAVAADLLARGLGTAGARAVAAVVALAALTSANATLLLGSRLVYAFGRDEALFSTLGRWSGRAGTPVNAVLLQGGIALGLVLFGVASRRGFEAMVAYTAPVFWLFVLLTTISLFVLRRTDPDAPRPFRVPLYPITPALFAATCLYLLWSSVRHAGAGAIAGVLVLATGLVPLRLSHRRVPARPAEA